jgi:hypothetical protein
VRIGWIVCNSALEGQGHLIKGQSKEQWPGKLGDSRHDKVQVSALLPPLLAVLPDPVRDLQQSCINYQRIPRLCIGSSL